MFTAQVWLTSSCKKPPKTPGKRLLPILVSSKFPNLRGFIDQPFQLTSIHPKIISKANSDLNVVTVSLSHFLNFLKLSHYFCFKKKICFYKEQTSKTIIRTPYCDMIMFNVCSKTAWCDEQKINVLYISVWRWSFSSKNEKAFKWSTRVSTKLLNNRIVFWWIYKLLRFNSSGEFPNCPLFLTVVSFQNSSVLLTVVSFQNTHLYWFWWVSNVLSFTNGGEFPVCANRLECIALKKKQERWNMLCVGAYISILNSKNE